MGKKRNAQFADFTDQQLRDFVSSAMSELRMRAVENGDPDAIISEAFQRSFDVSGGIKSPFIIEGYVAIPGHIQDSSGSRHICNLSTVTMPDGGVFWAWGDECETFVHSDSEQLSGIRRSVALHLIVAGSIIARHTMRWDGERHNRLQSIAWQVTEDERLRPVTSYKPGHLPPPNGEVDQRSYKARTKSPTDTIKSRQN